MSGIQQFLLPSNNTWTGPNNFQNNNVFNSSTDYTLSWPEWVQSFAPTFLPKGRTTYQWEAATSDNPYQRHSRISIGINHDPFTNTSDDGSGTSLEMGLERRYTGAPRCSITSITVVAGVGTFVVSSNSSIYNFTGIYVNENSNSAYNQYWIVQNVSSSTSFTAILTSGTATTGSGTGGFVYQEGSEFNIAFDGYRWMAVAGRDGNPSQDGAIGFSYPVGIQVPTNFASLGGIGGAALGIQGAQSSSSTSGRIILSLWNTDATNKRSQIDFINDVSGKNWSLFNAAAAGSGNDFNLFDGVGFVTKYVGNGSNRVLWFGATDDSATNFQIQGTLRTTGLATFAAGITQSGTFTQNGGSGTFTITPGAAAIPVFTAFTVTDASPNIAIIAKTSGASAIDCDRYAMSNASGGQPLLRFRGSTGIVSSTQLDIGSIQGDMNANVPANLLLSTASGVQLSLTSTGANTVITANGAEYDFFSNQAQFPSLQLDTKLIITAGSNKRAGTVTLTAGAATVTNTAVTAKSTVLLCLKTVGGTIAGLPYVDTITPTTGFTVAGGGASNTSTYNYIIIETS